MTSTDKSIVCPCGTCTRVCFRPRETMDECIPFQKWLARPKLDRMT